MPLTLRDRIALAAAQFDGRLSDDPRDLDLGWIFYREFTKQDIEFNRRAEAPRCQD